MNRSPKGSSLLLTVNPLQSRHTTFVNVLETDVKIIGTFGARPIGQFFEE
jgi:hypothetical protein